MEVVSLAATEEAPAVQQHATPSEVSNSMDNLHIAASIPRSAHIPCASKDQRLLSALQLFILVSLPVYALIHITCTSTCINMQGTIWHAESYATCASRPAEAPATASRSATSTRQQHAEASSSQVVYARGPIADLPEEHASRRERFAELDELQPGWQVELCSRGAGSAIDAIFYSPSGE